MKIILLLTLIATTFIGCDSREEYFKKIELQAKALTQDSVNHPESVAIMPDGRVLKLIKVYRSESLFALVYYFELPNTKIPDTNTISVHYSYGKNSHQTIVLDGKEYNISPK